MWMTEREKERKKGERDRERGGGGGDTISWHMTMYRNNDTRTIW